MPRTIAGEDSNGVQRTLRTDASGNILLGSASAGSTTIAGPLDRKADAASVSVALSTEDVALITALNTVLGLTSDAGVSTDAAGSINAHLRGALVELIALLATAGATADAAVTAGATGSINAHLRSISRDLIANIVLAAGSAIIGKVGIDQTTPGTTNLVDTELAAAVAYADALSKPTTAPVEAWLVGYNGATGDMVRVQSVSYDMAAIAITTIATVATPTSGKQVRLMGGSFSVSAACSVLFENNAGAGGTIFRTPQLLANVPYSFDLGNGVLVSTANHVLKATASTGTVTITGTLRGTEE